MAKETNEVISNYSSQILGCQAYIENNNRNRTKCENSKNLKDNHKTKVKSRIASKIKNRKVLEDKREKYFIRLIPIKMLLILPLSIAFSMLLAHLLVAPYILTGLSMILWMISSAIIDGVTITRVNKKLKELDEEILKDEQECVDLENEMARIQVTIDKIDMANKFTEEKIAIIKDAIKQIEEMISPEGAQKVIQVQPSMGVQNSNNVQFRSSNTHQLALN